MGISNFSELFLSLKEQPLQRLVVANGIDEHSLEAVFRAVEMGIIEVSITGNKALIDKTCIKLGFKKDQYDAIHCSDESEAVKLAVDLARKGEANLIMKGLTTTDTFMRAVLNKELGILPKGNLLTHITLLKNSNYHKPLLISDVAIIPLPNYDQKVIMTEYLIKVAHNLGIERPKVAFLAATEKVIQKMPACVDADRLKTFAKNGGFGNAICEGPFALDVAIDIESAKIKGIESVVAGDADCLLFPNIESGNVFYKTNTKLCNAQTAAMVIGTSVPTVLSSRGDSTETKLNSIALAASIK